MNISENMTSYSYNVSEGCVAPILPKIFLKMYLLTHSKPRVGILYLFKISKSVNQLINQSLPVAPRAKHRVSMNSRHHHLFCASSSKSLQHSSPASCLIVRTHVSFCLPLPLLPCTCHPCVPIRICRRGLAVSISPL